MSAIYFVDIETFAVLFEFDADIKESRRGSVKWTDKPVEEGANIADFGKRGPGRFRVEGVITAWPFGSPVNPLRVTGADAALEAMAEAMQPVTLITNWWSRTVVLSTDEASSGQGDGDMLRFSVGCQTIKLPKPVYVSIPPSRLKPRVRKRNGPPSGQDLPLLPGQGGAAAGKKKPTTAPAKEKQKDWFYKLKGFLS